MTTNSFIQRLDFVDNEDEFIEFVLYHIKHLCQYVIKNPKPTIFHDSHHYVSKLLKYFNDALLHQSGAPGVRIAYLFKKINHISQKLPKQGFTRNLADEFLESVKSAQNVANDVMNEIITGNIAKLSRLTNLYTKTLLTESEIRKKRNLIPFNVVRTHLTGLEGIIISTKEKFYNWFISIVDKYKFSMELNMCGYFKNSKGDYLKTKPKASAFMISTNGEVIADIPLRWKQCSPRARNSIDYKGLYNEKNSNAVSNSSNEYMDSDTMVSAEPIDSFNRFRLGFSS